MFFTSLPMHQKLRHDVAMATSRRRTSGKPAEEESATSGRNLKVKGL